MGAPYRPSVPPGASQKQALALVTEEMMQRIAALLPASYRGSYGERPPASQHPLQPAPASAPATAEIDPTC